MLIAAFTRATRDPFVHARNAALLAFAATIEFFSEDDCASKIMPAICPALLDKEKYVHYPMVYRLALTDGVQACT